MQVKHVGSMIAVIGGLCCADRGDPDTPTPEAHASPYLRLDVRLDDAVGTNEIQLSPTQTSALSGSFRLTFENDPGNAQWPMRLVAVDAFDLRGGSIQLDHDTASGQLVLRRDFSLVVSGGYNRKTGSLWARIPATFTAEGFSGDDAWTITGDDVGPHPRPSFTTVVLQGSARDQFSGTATALIGAGVPLFSATELEAAVNGRAYFESLGSLFPARQQFALRIKVIAEDAQGAGMIHSGTEIVGALAEVNRIWGQCCIEMFFDDTASSCGSAPCSNCFHCIPSASAFAGSDGNLFCLDSPNNAYTAANVEMDFTLDYEDALPAGYPQVLEVVIADQLGDETGPSSCGSNKQGLGWNGIPEVVVGPEVMVDPSGSSLGRAIAHELGHALWLDHPEPFVPGALMSGGETLSPLECAVAQNNLAWIVPETSGAPPPTCQFSPL
jgi:hypothetical protein